jgi:carbonic anhydrase
MVDAWGRGQKVKIHGWTFGVHDGLLQDLGLNVDGAKPLDAVYKAAVQRIRYKWSKPLGASPSGQAGADGIAAEAAPAIPTVDAVQPAAGNETKTG